MSEIKHRAVYFCNIGRLPRKKAEEYLKEARERIQKHWPDFSVLTIPVSEERFVRFEVLPNMEKYVG